MTTPRISVVVAFFNNEDDLGDCLDSIAAQTYPDLEVIMVDDGSSDHSAEIARAKAAADPRFTLLQPEHGGPGGARNRGVERARGEYLAFVDGDDVLPANAYELLLHALERSGSDFVSGAVDRVGPKGITPSALHSLALKGRQTGTHVTRTPRLLYDVSVWNKLFRRSFWDQHQLSYPEGVVWEDLRLMTKAHVLARAVDVIPDIVYYWRERAQGGLSITQSRTSVANLRDRMTAMNDIDQFIAAHSTAKLLRAHQRKALKNDLWLYVQDLHKVTDAYRAEFADLVNGYLDQRRPPGAAQPARPPQAGLLPGADPGHAAARRAGRMARGAAGAPGSRGPAVGQAPRRPAVPDELAGADPVPRVPPALARPGPVHAGGRHRVGGRTAGGHRPGQRAVGRHPPPPEHLQDPGAAPAWSPAPGRAARPLVPQPGGHGPVRAGQVQLRLVGIPVRGQPPAVPRHRGVAVLHARPGARRLAAGPGAQPGTRPGGAAAAPSGGARPAVRRPLGRSRPEPGGVAARCDGRRRGLAGRRPAFGAD